MAIHTILDNKTKSFQLTKIKTLDLSHEGILRRCKFAKTKIVLLEIKLI